MSELLNTTAIVEQKPIVLIQGIEHSSHVALPPGWKLESIDEEKLLDRPRRKRGTVKAHDTDSFIAFVSEHALDSFSSIWVDANYEEGNVRFTAILNEHGPTINHGNWRDFIARFEPQKSVEWKRWTDSNRKPFTQVEFAAFIEENGLNIAQAEGMPTGAQMLEMALNMEANQETRFKSAIRLQSGSTQLHFVEDEDKGTLTKMQLFEKFAIGIPVFWGGAAYQINARLRYRARDAKLSFWYELIRPDKILEAAAQEIVNTVKEKTGVPLYFGNPF
jgi:uncharacterized protein YfdQ (DUF2303 family)